MNWHKYSDSRFLWSFSFGLTLLVYFVGMMVTTMEIDAAVYAEISREMYRNGNWAELFLHGQDWMDKPHFQFWITAISFKIFGVSSFSYKLPAVLFVLLGIYYTYKFGERFYSKKHGYLAALLLMTSQHIITSNSDVRAEPYLTGLTIFSLYYLAVYLRERKFYRLVLGAFGLASLLMTKGLFTIIPTASGLGLALLFEKKWKEILHWQWLAVIGLTFVFISPVLYSYYIQFDLHPEKVIFGETNVSGLRFFLWDSQWGRFTNTGPIRGAGDPLFFLHTILWAYLPWAFVAYFAMYTKTIALIRRTNRSESHTYFGFLLLFIVFSASRFQLPHYLNALFPFLSIVTADCLLAYAKNRKFLTIFYHIQIWSGALLVVGVLLIHFIFSDQYPSLDIFIVFLIGISIVVFLLRTKGRYLKKIIFVPAITVLVVNYYINRSFYPELLKFQAESEVAYYLKDQSLDVDNLIAYGLTEDMISFIHDKIVPQYELDSVKAKDLEGKYVFTNRGGIDKVESMGLHHEIIEVFPDFRITTLSATFINKKTRDKAVELKYLLKVN